MARPAVVNLAPGFKMHLYGWHQTTPIFSQVGLCSTLDLYSPVNLIKLCIMRNFKNVQGFFQIYAGFLFLFTHSHSNQKAFCIFSTILWLKNLILFEGVHCLCLHYYSQLLSIQAAIPFSSAYCVVHFLKNVSFQSLNFFSSFLVQMIDFQSLKTLPLLLPILLPRSLHLRRTFKHPKVKYLEGASHKALQFWPRATALKREKRKCWLRVYGWCARVKPRGQQFV